MSEPLNYSNYLHVPELLSLQEPRSDPAQHDELLFIVIHQTYELWFKQLLHEIDRAKRLLSGGRIFRTISVFKRMRTIMKTLVGQLDILETMTPLSFSSFREFECALGVKRADAMKYLEPNWPGTAAAVRRFEEPTLIDHLYEFLELHECEVPDALKSRDVRESNVPDETIQAGCLRLYRERPEMRVLFEMMLDFDEGLQEWRYRHVKLVERTIGAKKGTGGSPGMEFLKRSLFVPVFADLWAIRHEL